MSILFSLASSIEPGLFSFYQTNSLELERLLSNKKEQPKKYQPVLVKEEGYVGTISNYYNEKEYYYNEKRHFSLHLRAEYYSLFN